MSKHNDNFNNLKPTSYCNGKVGYDKKGAMTAKNKRWGDDHVKLRIYNCNMCNRWHLTSVPHASEI